jgi:hypothetical protein
MEVFRDCIGPTWLSEPLSLEETAERYLPSAMQQTFVDLCRQPVSQYLERCVGGSYRACRFVGRVQGFKVCGGCPGLKVFLAGGGGAHGVSEEDSRAPAATRLAAGMFVIHVDHTRYTCGSHTL